MPTRSLARCSVSNPDVNTLVPCIIHFCNVADPAQMRLAPHKGRRCCPHDVLNELRADCCTNTSAGPLVPRSPSVGILANYLARFCASAPIMALDPLTNLLTRFVGTSSACLTALHAPLLLTSLRANSFNQASYVLYNMPVSSIAQKVTRCLSIRPRARQTDAALLSTFP